MLTFEKASPEAVGIPGSCIINFIDRLGHRNIPMHSLLLMRHDKLVFEGYYAPYTAGTPHRMFSISKSFTSIAIGLLAEEGRLSLDDTIVSFFPEKLPANVHPWIASMTIRDMLMMRSCHAQTTYKLNMASDWVESFFTTPPTHPPGRIFHYDTSAAHTLCALAEKLTGMVMLDYLKKKLDCLGLSEQSYMLKDPFGVSIGGSGLVALPMDLLRFGYFIAHRGLVCGRQLMSPSYIDMAVSCLSETRITAPVPSEAQGYGMQFWRGEKNGYTCYGMGGQLIIFLPDYDMICVTTADTQGIGGGNQQIYDALYEEILPYIQDGALPSDAESSRLLAQTASSLRIEPLRNLGKGSLAETMPNKTTLTETVLSETMLNETALAETALTNAISSVSALTKTVERINGKTFTVRTPDSGFESFTVRFDADYGSDSDFNSDSDFKSEFDSESDSNSGFDSVPDSNSTFDSIGKSIGSLSFIYKHKPYSLKFGMGCMQTGSFPIYNMKYAASGIWLSDGTLYIKAHIIDAYVGSVHFQLSFGENDLTIFMRKQEESLFQEFNGHLYCT